MLKIGRGREREACKWLFLVETLEHDGDNNDDNDDDDDNNDDENDHDDGSEKMLGIMVLVMVVSLTYLKGPHPC